MNNPTKFSNRLGVDIGGTFTDIVLETNSKRFSAKVLTDNANPEMAIFKGIDDVCLKADIAPSDLTQIIHGTTLATNSLIERKGAKTALITTEGFRDVIEMRTESRFEQYDLNLSLPDPLLSREHRYVLKERIDAQGRVLIPIEQRAVEDLANELMIILKSKRDEIVFKMKLTSKDEFEILSKRVENLENKIEKLEKIKKKLNR